jgi:hypothetical protein
MKMVLPVLIIERYFLQKNKIKINLGAKKWSFVLHYGGQNANQDVVTITGCLWRWRRDYPDAVNHQGNMRPISL